MGVKKIFRRRILPFAFAMIISAGCLASGVTADTMSDLEAKQAQLEKDRKNVEAALEDYKGKAEEEAEYLKEYDKKMELQEEQVAIVEEQIKLLNEEIEGLEARRKSWTLVSSSFVSGSALSIWRETTALLL